MIKIIFGQMPYGTATHKHFKVFWTLVCVLGDALFFDFLKPDFHKDGECYRTYGIEKKYCVKCYTEKKIKNIFIT